MSSRAIAQIQILPYSRIVGQGQLKLALELAYVAPRLGGVLLSGQRGTAKSTAVRAFAGMAYGELPVTLPINATEDRVVGGWQIDELLGGRAVQQPGLLERAAGSGLLYVDEINLLDDHIVNIILDVTSTGVLVVEREGQERVKELRFTLVGTMNPEEGGLRPQLLDRFGLMVDIQTEDARRAEILRTMLAFDAALEALPGADDPWLAEGRALDEERRADLGAARDRLSQVEFPDHLAQQCVDLATGFQAKGLRGDYVLALAGRACAALDAAPRVTSAHLRRLAPLVFQHRRAGAAETGFTSWGPADDQRVQDALPDA